MKQLSWLVTVTVAAVLLGVLLPPDSAFAQTINRQFTGSSWTLISGTIERGGKKVRLTAPRLQGFLVFDGNDRFLIVIARSGSSGFAFTRGQVRTPGENQATLQRSIACFGTYSVNEADHSINAHIEGSTFPKWVGTDQKRRFTIDGNKLKWTNTSSSGAGGTAELVWKRAK